MKAGPEMVKHVAVQLIFCCVSSMSKLLMKSLGRHSTNVSKLLVCLVSKYGCKCDNRKYVCLIPLSIGH